jgi:hypothetical protein
MLSGVNEAPGPAAISPALAWDLEDAELLVEMEIEDDGLLPW